MDTPQSCATMEDTLERKVLKVIRDYSSHLAVWLQSCCSPQQATGTYGDKSASYLPRMQRGSSPCALHLHDCHTFIALALQKQLTPMIISFLKQRPNSTANANQMDVGSILSQYNIRLGLLCLFLLWTLHQTSQSSHTDPVFSQVTTLW